MADLKTLNLPLRAQYALARAGITTTEQVDRMSDADLLAVKGFGKGCLIATRAKLGARKKTNADKIREMSDEELTDALTKLREPAKEG